ncbi:MAG: hypothetical protein HQK83_09590 [Fibrobacteria bacterium]|nr:hypothetical protein [Fibrobacteria bacterium]
MKVNRVTTIVIARLDRAIHPRIDDLMDSASLPASHPSGCQCTAWQRSSHIPVLDYPGQAG